MRSRRPRPIAAPAATECHRCGQVMEHTRDMTRIRGRWIHKRCAGGGDDQ